MTTHHPKFSIHTALQLVGLTTEKRFPISMFNAHNMLKTGTNPQGTGYQVSMTKGPALHRCKQTSIFLKQIILETFFSGHAAQYNTVMIALTNVSSKGSTGIDWSGRGASVEQQ